MIMSKNVVAKGVVHNVPTDLRNALTSDKTAHTLWEKLTPLARNEWICWVEDAKKTQTSSSRIEGVCTELKEGKKRPCCWPGCQH